MAKKVLKKAENGGDSTAWKQRTFPKLSTKGLDSEIARLSKMVTSKSAPSVIQQKIDMLEREKIRRKGTPGQTVNTTTSKKKGGSVNSKKRK